jgi:preprotein translocase subunit SecG
MSTVLVILHVVVCIFLIAVVLLQRGRGAEIGAVFGGGASSTVFGSRGAGSFLSKLTTAAAVLFMLTSLSLSYVWTQGSQDRLFNEPVPAGEAPAQAPAAPEALFQEVQPPAPAAEGALPPLEAPGAPAAPAAEAALPPLEAPAAGSGSETP